MRAHHSIVCALLFGLGCAHTAQTGKNGDGKDATAPRSSKSAARASQGTPTGQPPLAASPSELVEPGSQQKIAQALKGKGVIDRDDIRGEQLSAALRKFQQGQGLAATGFPDHETLRRLGIDPEEVDRARENDSGTKAGEPQAGVSKPSDDAATGGSGTESSGRKGGTSHDTPPSDQAGKGGSKTSDSSNSGD